MPHAQHLAFNACTMHFDLQVIDLRHAHVRKPSGGEGACPPADTELRSGWRAQQPCRCNSRRLLLNCALSMGPNAVEQPNGKE